MFRHEIEEVIAVMLPVYPDFRSRFVKLIQDIEKLRITATSDEEKANLLQAMIVGSKIGARRIASCLS